VGIVGSAKEVAEQLKAEQELYGFEEAMICSIPHSQEKRPDVYKLLAKELL
jgi:alkanesulfonate monooxygenase SsuD/methylene tetrahydromethanopterin reductase-like flavin-dependent oxidoreductase (luciferase family)